jgi:hypothetical protein
MNAELDGFTNLIIARGPAIAAAVAAARSSIVITGMLTRTFLYRLVEKRLAGTRRAKGVE